MPTIDTTQFRSDFPEFASTVAFPDATVQVWLGFAENFLTNAERWATSLQLGQELIAAHYLVLAMRDQAAVSAGGNAGVALGLQTAKSVGDVSVSYDYSVTSPQDAGFWNATSYGQRYYLMARAFGAGALQIGPGWCY
jgi:hypothetical protein